VAHLAFSVGDALSNAPISIISSWHRTSKSVDANRGSPSGVLWMPRWRSVGIDKRLGKVAAAHGRPSSPRLSVSVVHVRVSLGGGTWCDEQCHVSMGRGKAREMQVMERDFRLGSAREPDVPIMSAEGERVLSEKRRGNLETA
jgi:hypothetical protein